MSAMGCDAETGLTGNTLGIFQARRYLRVRRRNFCCWNNEGLERAGEKEGDPRTLFHKAVDTQKLLESRLGLDHYLLYNTYRITLSKYALSALKLCKSCV